MDTANRLWPSLQHNNLTLLSRLLNLAAENAELFFTRRRHSRSERRRVLQRAVAHAFMQPEWQHLKKLHHGEIDLFISRGLATGNVIRYLRKPQKYVCACRLSISRVFPARWMNFAIRDSQLIPGFPNGVLC